MANKIQKSLQSVQATASNPSSLIDSVATSDFIGLTNASDSQASAASLKNFIRERSVDGTKWNKIYPYVLRLGSFSAVDAGGLNIQRNISSTVKNIATSKGLNFNKLGNAPKNEVKSIVLPIAPQNISVSTPAASQLTVLLRGILEEHNGAPLRSIRISGTTGVNPLKKSYFGGTKPSGLVGELFSNTINAVNALSSAIKGSDTTYLSDKDLFNDSASDPSLLPTGYMFLHTMVNFVDQYFYYKKQKQNKDMYVVFEMQKDDLFYKCSIRNFTFQKRPGTLEYDYTLDLVAWGYEKIAPAGITGITSLDDKIGTISRVVATVKKTRNIIAKARNVIKGLGQDADRLFLIMQEINMAAKESIALTKSLADLPQNMAKSFKSLVVSSASSVMDEAYAALQSNSQSAKLATNSAKIVTGQTQSGPNQSLQSSADVRINKIFEDPYGNPDFFDAIGLDALTIPQTLQDQIDDEAYRTSNLDTQYWIERRDELVNISNGIANMVGLGSPTYNRILGNEGIQSRTRTPRAQELEILKSLGDLIQQANSFIVLKRKSDQSIRNYVDFYINMAVSNGIALQNPVSKFSVPMPYGATLQSLAVQYLGDASRWLEIAAVNGLRAPFIDEDGFTKNIKGSTNGSVITVSNADNLYINQPVLVQDNANPAVSGRIKKIEIIDNVTVLLTLNQDVTGYGESTSATIRAYLPNTVNSNMLIYIPTSAQPTVLAEDFKFSPDNNDQSVLAAIAGSDILLTSEGDIAVLPSGDVRTTIGVANLTQAATLKLVTPLGSLVQHPDYGLGVLAGTPTSEFDANKAFGDIETAFQNDDRFQSVLASKITKKGNTVTIDLALQLPNTDSILPMTINLRQ